jgi:hypothetical protein
MEASRLHFHSEKKLFYLTRAIILDPNEQYEELDEEYQLSDVNILIPDGITQQEIMDNLMDKQQSPEFVDAALYPTLHTELPQPFPILNGNEFLYANGLPLVVSPSDIHLPPTNTTEKTDDSDEKEDKPDYLQYVIFPDELESVANEEPADAGKAPGHEEHQLYSWDTEIK